MGTNPQREHRMSETTTEATATATEGTEQQTEQAKPTETVDFWKQKAREQEKRAKDNAEAAKRLAEIEDSQKSETEKAAAKLTEAESRAALAEAALLRYEVASEKGIPANAVKFLNGSTREEIEASAKDVLELIGEAGKPRPPKPNPDQGRPGNGGTASNGDLFAAAVEGSFTR